MFFEFLRNKSFWLLDTLRGGKIEKHLREISQIIEGPESSLAHHLIKQRITKILNHATASTQFYKELKDQPLQKFPVINKTIIRNSFDNFVSLSFPLDTLYSAITSGSTGTPFKIYKDRRKRERNYADTIYFSRQAGFEIGHRLIYLKIWVEKKMRSKPEYWFQNIVPVDVVHLDDQVIESLIRKIESDKSTFGILGYASILELICRYLDRKQSFFVKANIRSIIAMSESLNEYTKTKMKEYFGVQVVSRYSNLENGIIAQQENKWLRKIFNQYRQLLCRDNENEFR